MRPQVVLMSFGQNVRTSGHQQAMRSSLTKMARSTHSTRDTARNAWQSMTKHRQHQRTSAAWRNSCTARRWAQATPVSQSTSMIAL